MEQVNPIGRLRPIEARDIPAVLELYAPYILETSISFETEVPSLEAFKERVATITKRFPWLVYEENQVIYGYCYGGPFRTRAAYRWSAELSVYVRQGHWGRSIGTSMYTALLEILAKAGFRQAYSCICVPNPGSERLHDAFDFLQCGRMEAVAFKLGKWRDMAILRRPLLDADSPPEETLLLSELDKKEVEAILTRCAGMVKPMKNP